jgi:hypothetical protein
MKQVSLMSHEIGKLKKKKKKKRRRVRHPEFHGGLPPTNYPDSTELNFRVR